MRIGEERASDRESEMPRSYQIVVMALAVLLSALSSCDSTALSSSGVVEVWATHPSPLLSIGVLEGEDPYLFTSIVGSTRLAGGRIAIADRGSQEVRLFDDSSGVFLEKVGGRGGGPGEFLALSWIRARGDTLITYDAQADRVTFFGPELSPATTFRLAVPALESWSILGPFHDGSYVGVSRAPTRDAPAGLREDTVSFYRMEPDGQTAQPILHVPGRDLYRVIERSGAETFALDVSPPFGRDILYAWTPEVIWVGKTHEAEIVGYSARGEKVAAISRTLTPREVSHEAARQYKRAAVQSARRPVFEKYIEEALSEAEPQQTYPTLSGLQTDALDRVWVARYVLPGEPQVLWDVYDRSGKHLAEGRIPEGLEVLEIGEDYLLGIRFDDLGVQRVEGYQIVRGAQRP